MGSICSRSESETTKPDVISEPFGEKLLEEEFFSALKSNKIQDDSVPPEKYSKATKIDALLELSRGHSLSFDSRARFDISTNDYRAFCLLIHRKQGAVLLHCTRKKQKPPHYQLPGGHVDSCEFKQISKSLSNYVTQEQLYFAARIGCAREVYEETGIEFRNRLEEFLPLILYDRKEGKPENETLINEYKNRIFFVCEISDEDFPCAVRNSKDMSASCLQIQIFKKLIPYYFNVSFHSNQQMDESMRFSSTRFPSLPNDFSCDLMLQLSVEHSGFRFFSESLEIANNLKLHSGGKVEKAITMAYNLSD